MATVVWLMPAVAVFAQNGGNLNPVYHTIKSGDGAVVDCLSDPVQIGVELIGPNHMAAIYSWNTGATTPHISVHPETSTTYEVTTVVPEASIVIVDTFRIIVDERPLVASGPDFMTGAGHCPGDPVKIFVVTSGGHQNYQVQWSTGATQTQITVNPKETTTYTALVSDACGRDTIETTVTVNITPPPPLSIVGLEGVTLSCPDRTFSVQADQANGAGGVGDGYVFSWDNWQSTNPVLQEQPSQNTTYTLHMTDRCGLDTVSASMQVTLKDYDPPKLTVTAAQRICRGDEAVLEASAEGGLPPYAISWTGGADGPVARVTPEVNTTYYAVLHDACNTMLSAAVDVVVGHPVAAFTYEYTDDNTVQFINRSSGSALSYAWEFGRDGKSTQEHPSRTVYSGSALTVQLTVTDEAGCEATVEGEIEPPVNVYVPSAFSPNNDGLNDHFKMGSQGGILKFHIDIFNRWGALVFTSEDPNFEWDGRSFDGQAPMGSYVYKLRAVGHSGQVIEKKGTVSVIAR